MRFFLLINEIQKVYLRQFNSTLFFLMTNIKMRKMQIFYVENLFSADFNYLLGNQDRKYFSVSLMKVYKSQNEKETLKVLITCLIHRQ